MDLESKKLDVLTGINKQYLQRIYKQYLENPSSVPEDWQTLFETLGDNLETFLREELLEQEVDAALFHKLRGNQGYQSQASLNTAGFCIEKEDVKRSVAALMMIHAYRALGHTNAQLDPLGVRQLTPAPELSAAHFGFTEADLNRPIFIGGSLGLDVAPLRQIVQILEETYCGPYAVEFVHCHDPAQKLWIQKKIEGFVAKKVLSKEERLTVLDHLIQAETLEKFIYTKHTGAKKFGIDGLESFVPALKEIISVSSEKGVDEAIIGMAHRGRLNVLCNIMGKPLESVFAEFLGTVDRKDDQNSGDVKYHLGFSSDMFFGKKKVHLALLPNPSHLEAVNAVVLGKVRAKQNMSKDAAREKVMGVLVHGDAAFIGQGVVAECFNFSNLQGYRTGGTLHVVTNNQIGFTTNPSHSRSSFHCTDLAKIIQAPVFHVNGDDVDSVVFMARVAAEFRAEFHKDVVLDIVGYRRFGHNEGDDPTFTQPKMYRIIKEHASALSLYSEQLKKDLVLTEEDFKKRVEKRLEELQKAYEQAAAGYKEKVDWFRGNWKGLELPEKKSVQTGISKKQIETILKKLTEIPDSFKPHSKLPRLLDAKKKMRETGKGLDWATGEALAFGSLLMDGTPVRLSGQDSVRGAFSQRHAAWIDQETEEWYVPLRHLEASQAAFDVINSPLSEFSILGFEYGYSMTDPLSLVLWEAQFGDFANGAQVVFDQFISSSEVKWHRLSGLVVLLPHGYEGQGPEHSSARLERYLQLCAEDNMSVANCTTPANYFHILRRQIKRKFRVPLILMTPKSLLRHKEAVSSNEDFMGSSEFHPVIDEPKSF